MAISSGARALVAQLSAQVRRALAPAAVSFACTILLAGCPGVIGSGEPTKYSGGGPIPEESEVLEKVRKMPPVGRYAPEPPGPKSGRRGSRARRGS
jgi:hypothetical protein